MGKKFLTRENIATSVIAFIIILASFAPQLWQGRRLRIDVFDIGQGDAILITTPDNERILVDGGPDGTVTAKVAGRLGFFNRTLDLMIATHPQVDHITGLITILDRFTVMRALLTMIRNETPEYAALRAALLAHDVPILDPADTPTITIGDKHPVTLHVLWPNRSYSDRIVDDPNDISTVFRLTYGDTSFLFTGDATSVIEDELVAHDVDMHADVLKVGHHGSDTSTTQAFLDRVHPSIAAISVGRNNHFGHPSRLILHRLERKGVAIYRTDLLGDIRITSDGKTIRVAQ